MKLHTSIIPRRDGTVKVDGLNGVKYVFTLDSEGEMSADVDHDETIAHLLASGNFYPADPEEFEVALKLATQNMPDQDEDLDDLEENSDALPVEAGTPIAPLKRTRKAK